MSKCVTGEVSTGGRNTQVRAGLRDGLPVSAAQAPSAALWWYDDRSCLQAWVTGSQCRWPSRPRTKCRPAGIVPG